MQPLTITFDQIIAPVADHVRNFEDRFSAALNSDVGKVQIMSRYLHDNRGKHFRPALALLTTISTEQL